RSVFMMSQLPEVILLTLTGHGGTGMTRVAVHAAANLLDDFGDGVYFVDLAPLTDGALILPTIARTVRADGAVAADAADALALHLRHRRVLLVLDNFEHLREAAPAVTAAVVAAGATKAIITSRVPHPIAGEHVFHVPPLETPAEGDRVERIAGSDAVALFASRARAIRHDFEVTTENAPAVGAICRALDGLPLAIELAATRVGVLPPPALLQRLDTRLALLKGRAP